jgi:GTP:adenosylcobinamide-phosphate guanylyltransferase
MHVPRTYEVVLLAGGSAKDASLSPDVSVPSKALLPIHGRPMFHYVVDAWRRSERMHRLIVVGLETPSLSALDVGCEVVTLPDQGSAVANLLAALETVRTCGMTAYSSADLPLLTPQAITHFLAACEASGASLCYPIVERHTMEAQFPGSGRTFRRTLDGDFCGGDIFGLTPEVARANLSFFRALSAGRKSALALARALGPGVILRLLTRQLRLSGLEARAGAILGAPCKAIISPHAEIAMDVDKPHHLEVVTRALASGASHA